MTVMALNQSAHRAVGGARRPEASARFIAPCAFHSQAFRHAALQQQRLLGSREHRILSKAQAGGPGGPSTKEEELPPWVRREKERELQAQQGAGKTTLPWGLALLFSVFTAIAATGSIFEYVDRNPIFGVIQPDNPAWAPILLFMAATGYPTAGILFKYGVDRFNEAAELQDRLDGYLPDDTKR